MCVPVLKESIIVQRPTSVASCLKKREKATFAFVCFPQIRASSSTLLWLPDHFPLSCLGAWLTVSHFHACLTGAHTPSSPVENSAVNWFAGQHLAGHCLLQSRTGCSSMLCFSDDLPASCLGSSKAATQTAFSPCVPIANFAVN